MIEATQLGRADVEKESVALPRLTFKSTQRGWPAGTQSSDATECIEGEEGALHAMTGLVQFEEHAGHGKPSWRISRTTRSGWL
jgi:hypothetical protein